MKNNRLYSKKMSQYDDKGNFIGYKAQIEIVRELYKGDTIIDNKKQAAKKRRRVEKAANKKRYREQKKQ